MSDETRLVWIDTAMHRRLVELAAEVGLTTQQLIEWILSDPEPEELS